MSNSQMLLLRGSSSTTIKVGVLLECNFYKFLVKQLVSLINGGKDGIQLFMSSKLNTLFTEQFGLKVIFEDEKENSASI
jgi:hypothetical protein